MRRLKFVFALLFGAGFFGTGYPATALECVPFARDVSGIGLRGDAWRWWDEAAGHYDRGKTPKVGSVAVFMKRGAMSHGHVAVVDRVIDHRHVLVDHANWAPNRSHQRGRVSMLVAVEDVSPRNDWTQVRVWNQASRDFGTRTYPVYGFIYAPSASYARPGAVHAVAFTPVTAGAKATGIDIDSVLMGTADPGPAAAPALPPASGEAGDIP